MMPLNCQRLFGPTLLGGNGSLTPVANALSNQVDFIGLFFTAEWALCNSAICDQLKTLCCSTSDSKKRLQIIFVSSDEDESAFQRTFDRMESCLAIPFSDLRKRLRLSRQYNVSSLPFLVLLNGRSGESISRVSREMLSRDPQCERFPWKQRPLREILTKADIVDAEGKNIPYEQLKDGVKALYFSANWCPPCKGFTPQLISTYEKVKSNGHKFEIIFVSSDRSEESYKSYHSTMPWPGIHWREQDLRKELAENLEVKGIPTLVILDSNLSIITKEGRSIVNEDLQAQEFPWKKQSVEILRGIHMSTFLEKPCLILFTDGEESELQFGINVLLPAAEEYYVDNPEDEGISLAFFVAGENDISERIREEANLDDVIPLLAIIDVKEGTKYLLEEGVEISNSTVHHFVTRFTKDLLIALPIDSEENLLTDEKSGSILRQDEATASCEES